MNPAVTQPLRSCSCISWLLYLCPSQQPACGLNWSSHLQHLWIWPLLGNSAVADVINLTGGHSESGWTLVQHVWWKKSRRDRFTRDTVWQWGGEWRLQKENSKREDLIKGTETKIQWVILNSLNDMKLKSYKWRIGRK